MRPSLSDIRLEVETADGDDEAPPPDNTKSSTSRRGVESAVTRLLVAIKHLLESLTSWSNQKTSEQDVSDVYVRLGDDFNACVAAFASFDIDMGQLRGIPEDLRNVLETCLAEDATPETLERFLPQVREIITDLLQGLRNKQSQFRAMSQERGAQRQAERQNSTSTAASDRQSNESSGSKPRPLPAPQIPEEEPVHPTPPPLPLEELPQVVEILRQLVSSKNSNGQLSTQDLEALAEIIRKISPQ
ncbi:hypothetical protein M407DRAFT_69025 [Tulasnella calospora MUT 4182]|uniref:Aip3p/Bud6 N-terminal domain-containing protein n=1 Tax=Tulasnella calospora MUT 4182 TaxID=1051891 RepID=A0A0C3L9J7_9AGAM|nr:hypothetical protein M407DRAFT_69025 [Tulasnella calospora MUT 4182]